MSKISVLANRYIPALTGLRGVAAWGVVFYHFSEAITILPEWVKAVVAHGYLAVDLFFILSGYVLYLASDLQTKSIKWESLWKFWVMRLIRIYPLHLVVMLLFLLNPLALHLFSSSGVVDDRYEIDYFVASLLLIQNWGFFSELKWNIPSWSISTEFFAYLVCPFLVWYGIARISLHRLKLIVSIVLVALVLAIVFFLNSLTSIGQAIPTLGLLRCLAEFWIGLCLGALASHELSQAYRIERHLSSLLIVSTSLLLVFLLATNIADFWFVPILFAVIIYLLGTQENVFSKLLSLRFIHYLGLISYSTYLIHFFIKDWVKFLSNSVAFTQFGVYVLACFVASVLAFHLVEKPSRVWLTKKSLNSL